MASSSSLSLSVTSPSPTSRFAISKSSSIDRSNDLPAIEGTRRKCEGKDALCRAMGALFLQHRVEKLQDDVDQLQYRRKEEGQSAKKCSWGRDWKAGCHGQGSRKVDEKRGGVKVPLSADSTTTSVIAASPSSIVEQQVTRNQAKRIIVADVSLLIYSLRTIHNWLKDSDCRVVIPMEALRTLDVLKKGNHYLNLAARKATRFLDERFLCEGSQSASSLRPGLVAQKESEKMTCKDWKTLIDEDGLEGNDELQQMSHSNRETLACSLYFFRELILSSSSTGEHRPDFCLALALPPPHFDCSEDVDGENAQWIKYGQRADGSVLLRYAKRLRLRSSSDSLESHLIVAPTAASWLTAEGTSKDCR